MRLTQSYLRPNRAQACVLSAAIAVAVAFTVLTAGGLHLRKIALSALVLTLAVVTFGSGASAVLHARRRDLATLRALGWRRTQVRRQLMREFALVAVAAGLLAVLASYAVEALLEAGPISGWPLLCLPAAIAMMLAAAWWPVRRVTAEAEPATTAVARLPAALSPRTAGQALRNLLRVPARTSVGVLVTAAACAALGLELDGRWAFSGAAGGSSPGGPAPWQANRVDVAAVLMLLAMATVTVADLDGLTAAELRTLWAIGWPARGVVRLVVWEAILVGLAGGLIASVLDVAGSLAVMPGTAVRPRLLLAVAVAGAGTVVSLLAAGLSAAARCRAAWANVLFTGDSPPFRTPPNRQ